MTEIRDLLGRTATASENIGSHIKAMLESGVSVIETPTPGPDVDKLTKLAEVMESLDDNFDFGLGCTDAG